MLLYILFLIIVILILKNHNGNCEKEKYIKTLSRQAARWALASEQDKNPLIKSLHANYASGYLWALLDIARPEEIEKVINKNFDEFKNEIVSIQDKANAEASRACPDYGMKSELALIAGEGV